MPNSPSHDGVPLNLLRGAAGALIGGAIGGAVFLGMVRQGFYMLALPGALLGLGCGLLIQQRSIALAAGGGVAALALGVALEWHAFPFVHDASFGYFLAHLHQLRPVTLIMILLGVAAGFYFALGTKGKRPPPAGTAG